MIFFYVTLFCLLVLLRFLLKIKKFYYELSISYELVAKELDLRIDKSFFCIPRLKGRYNDESLIIELYSKSQFFFPNSIKVIYGNFFIVEKGLHISKEKIVNILDLLERQEYDEIKRSQKKQIIIN